MRNEESPKMKSLIILEPLNHMYGVIKGAHRMGYKILALHSLPLSAPPPYEGAVECIDEKHEVEDWYDLEGILKKVKEKFSQYDIVGTYAAAEITLFFEAYYRALHSIPGNSMRCIEQNLNKYNVRKCLIEKGLSKVKALNDREISELTSWPFSNGAYFKPINGSGSARVTRCGNIDDVITATKSWANKDEIGIPVLKAYIEKDDGYFLEEEIVGELMSLECFTVNGVMHPLGLTSRTLLSRDKSIEMGANFPYEHPLKEKIIEKVNAIHQALEIQHGATHSEVIVCEDGDIELVEINLRFGGADLLYITSLAYGQERWSRIFEQADN